MTYPLIHMRNIGVTSSKKIILDSINLTMQENERVLLIGPNGSGKSTLLKIIAGLLTPTGDMSLLGHKPYSLEAKSIRAYVPQQIDFPPKIKIGEIIDFVQHHYKKMELTDKILSILNLNRKEYAFSLSGGEKRRLFLVLALLANPKLLLLDEPEGDLDIKFRDILLGEWVFNAKKNQMAVIMATHYFDHTLQFFDRVIILKEGKIIKDEGMHAFMKQKEHIMDYFGA